MGAESWALSFHFPHQLSDIFLENEKNSTTINSEWILVSVMGAETYALGRSGRFFTQLYHFVARKVNDIGIWNSRRIFMNLSSIAGKIISEIEAYSFQLWPLEVARSNNLKIQDMASLLCNKSQERVIINKKVILDPVMGVESRSLGKTFDFLTHLLYYSISHKIFNISF